MPYSFLYQPVFEYVKSKFTIHFTYHSSIIYDTEERARLCALDDWNNIKSDEDTLLNIEIRHLTIG